MRLPGRDFAAALGTLLLSPETGSASRVANITQFVWPSTFSSAWLTMSKWKRTRPREGLLLEILLSRTVICERRVSPGLTGLTHFTSSIPGAPMAEESRSSPSATRRMLRLQECHPEAISVPMKLSLAAISSTWKGWASYSRAKATMSSFETVRGPRVWVRPVGKSSNVRMGIPLLEPALAQRASRWETRRGIPGLCSVLPWRAVG